MPSKQDEERFVKESTVQETITWWIKHKNKVYSALLVVAGLCGGNLDRISEIINNILPDTQQVYDNTAEIKLLRAEIDRLRARPNPITIERRNIHIED